MISYDVIYEGVPPWQLGSVQLQGQGLAAGRALTRHYLATRRSGCWLMAGQRAAMKVSGWTMGVGEQGRETLP